MLNSTQATVESQVGSDQNPASHFTDYGNARRLVERFGPKLKYVKQWGWLVWDEKRWKLDETGQVVRFAKETILSLYQEAAKEPDDDKRRDLIDHARRSESLFHIKAMIELAQSEKEVIAWVDQFDRNPLLITVLNGTLDLSTGTLKPPDPADLITKLAPVEYNPSAKSDVWDTFIDEVCDRNKELREYLQRAAGYSLTGDTREHAFFIPWGKGRNGKSTLIEALSNIMGDYSATSLPSTFMKKDGFAGPTNDLASLAGARFVTSPETGSRGTLDVETIKRVTGQDKISARLLYKEQFSFVPQFKLWMPTNNKPKIDEFTPAIWARIKLIPFTVSFEGREDRKLPEKLKEAYPAILNWMVQGCMKWLREGLNEPKVVRDAVDEYRDEQDAIADFLLEQCDRVPGAEIKARALYGAYKAWAIENGIPPITETEFGTTMINHNFKKKRDSQGNRYQGIALKQPKENIPMLPNRPAMTLYKAPAAVGSNHVTHSRDPYLEDYTEEQ